MPHLSTLHWATLSLTFLFIFILFLTKGWWQNTPTYPKQKLNSFSKKPNS
uniref:ATP synthase F0 subunit 8 n=1 Tax=Phascolosoma pacificum TaxID=1634976 RepID=A0A1D8BES8_9ANNE|nr:ATP synthase F0 subunit 8 [Phascolosoma pacificum]AOS53038.1 ATP synthase F0 subunit 8 [Phascolosoma pacificum]